MYWRNAILLFLLNVKLNKELGEITGTCFWIFGIRWFARTRLRSGRPFWTAGAAAFRRPFWSLSKPCTPRSWASRLRLRPACRTRSFGHLWGPFAFAAPLFSRSRSFSARFRRTRRTPSLSASSSPLVSSSLPLA